MKTFEVLETSKVLTFEVLQTSNVSTLDKTSNV